MVLLNAGAALAQAPPACKDQLPCLQQRVLDLKDYREYLEDQLALAKALLQAANTTLNAKDAEIKALKDAAPSAPVPPPRPAPTP